jgi:hypothetical protein
MARWLKVAIVAVLACPAPAAAGSCSGACELVARACRIDARFERAGARALCDDVAGDCHAACEGGRATCRVACQATSEKCGGACAWNVDPEACKGKCNTVGGFCADRCGGTREDCSLWCAVDREKCVAGANQERNKSNAVCEDAKNACGESCTSGDGCSEACTRAGAVCFGGARIESKTCRGACKEADGREECAHRCRATQIAANTDCELTLESCIDECGVAAPANDTDTSTTTLGEPSGLLDMLNAEQ